MKKKISMIAAAAVLSMTAVNAMASTMSSGLTLSSNVGTLLVVCNNVLPAFEKPITNSPQTFPWIGIGFLFGSPNLDCTFEQQNTKQIVGTAHLVLTPTTGQISNIQTTNGYPMPQVTYSGPGTGGFHRGISVTLN